MVAKPLYPLYKNIIKPLDRVRYPELRYIFLVAALNFVFYLLIIFSTYFILYMVLILVVALGFNRGPMEGTAAHTAATKALMEA